MQVYLIRHGQSLTNIPGTEITAKNADPPLSDLGVQQAQHLARHLASARNVDTWVQERNGVTPKTPAVGAGFTHLYCSPMLRALQTAKILADALGMTPEVWIDLHEKGGIYHTVEGQFIGLSGLPRAAIGKQFPDFVLPAGITETGWYDVTLGRGTMEQCMTRAMRVASALYARAAQNRTLETLERIALVTHGTFSDLLLKALFNLLPTLPQDTRMITAYNTSVTRLDFLKEGTPAIRYLNRTDHLPIELMS